MEGASLKVGDAVHYFEGGHCGDYSEASYGVAVKITTFIDSFGDDDATIMLNTNEP